MTMVPIPNKWIVLGVSIATLASSTIPILCIALGVFGIVFSRRLIRNERLEGSPATILPRLALSISLVGIVVTIALMAFALPVALGW